MKFLFDTKQKEVSELLRKKELEVKAELDKRQKKRESYAHI